tara:strand:+ start:284 stop:928 length:645 start_codon:yes stop_codon:yes gene_type:complete
MSRKVVTVSADGSGGGGAAIYVPKLKTYTLYDYSVDGSATSVSAQFTDMGVPQDKILSVNIKGTSVQSSAAWHMRFFPLSSAGADQAGHMAVSFKGHYGGNGGIGSVTHNSNQNFIYWPNYSSAQHVNETYGGGMSFNFQMPVEAVGSGKRALPMGGMVHYQQNTSYTYPNIETFSWDNNSNDAPYPSIHGIKMKPSNGQFEGGTIIIEIWYKD